MQIEFCQGRSCIYLDMHSLKNMDKIYSRPRIRLPKVVLNGPNATNPKTRKMVKIIIILIIAFSTAKISLDAVYPIFDTLCENRAKSIATTVSNQQATNVMKQYSYEDLFSIEKDSDGNITMIKTNVVAINEIISDVPIKIQNEIDSKGRENIEIALGSFTGFKLLAGRGPGIKIRISCIGSVETDLKSEFISQGINQTLHRVYLDVKCKVAILTPFNDIEKEIVNQVLLMENVIVGNIPNTYYNLEGLNESDSLELIE